MKLIASLREEHELIERVALAFRTWAKELESHPDRMGDGPGFLRFFRVWAGDYHHEREETVLVPALTDEAELPRERGPISVIFDDHSRMASLLDRIESLIDQSTQGNDDSALADLVMDYSEALLVHIDVENSIFLPESESRLQRVGVFELDNRPATEPELDARQIGIDLASRYAADPASDVVRGEGCIICPSYGDPCNGIEAEWWNEYEWEELDGHVNAT